MQSKYPIRSSSGHADVLVCSLLHLSGRRGRKLEPFTGIRTIWEALSISSVKRGRLVKDRIRLWKKGVRDLVMELCCALHNFRVRLTTWQPMI